ncbi:MAG: TonB-dependent receptor [Bacteroidia bacterium]|nr:TonB-dependent receptor [Bacteroidia bacterium]
MRVRIVSFFVSGFICLSQFAGAQTANIRGFIYFSENAEPAIYTSVFLQGTNFGATTDLNGFFSITKIPAGSYTLMVTFVGYDTVSVPVTVKDGDLLTKKLYLKKSIKELKEVEVSAEKQENKTDVKISVNKITPREMKQVPTIGGEPDLAQYLQILPGVIFTGDQGGQLYIRGGSPIQNKVLLDGMTIYNPFHSIGLFSVFDPDIIRGVDVYTGGFNAQYGGRISSVMDITTRDGNKKRVSGKFGANTFSSKLILEGPLKKLDEESGGSSSFILAGKTSYMQQSSKVFYKYINENGLPYNFTDIYGKISLNNSGGSKLNLFGFHFTDNVDYSDISKLDWNSNGFGANFVAVPSGSSVLLEGTVAHSDYKVTLAETGKKDRSSSISSTNFGLNFSYFMGKDEVQYGLEVQTFSTDFNFYNSLNRAITQNDNSTELGGYLRYKKVAGKFVIEPGLRSNYYASLSEISLEPRFGIKYNVTDKVRLKAAGGLYTQNLLSASSDHDVVNLFYGFLSGSDDLPETFDGKDVTSKLQSAGHAIAGIEIDLPSHLSLNIEAYIKDFLQLENLNRNKLYDSNSNKPDELKKDFIIETGTAKGIDFLLKYDYRRVYLWLVYSLGYVDRFDGTINYTPHFDRRHNVNVVAAYTFGKKLNWEANARWNFGSGFPFTKQAGFYEQLTFSNGLNTDYTTANGDLGIVYGELNKGQLPAYHRLDFSLKRTFILSNRSTLEANVSVINGYDRQNIFYVDRVTNKRVDQLPFLPSAGVSLTF